MKRKRIANILFCILAAAMLTACDGEAVEGEAAKAEEQGAYAETGQEEKVETETAGTQISKAQKRASISDEDFELLQEAYAELTELYDVTRNLYEQSGITGSASIESSLNHAAEVLETVGEKEQDGMTEQDALALLDQMNQEVDALDRCSDQIMKEMEEGDYTTAAVDDEVFAELQDTYKELVDLYNTIVDAYNAGELKQSADAKEILDDAAELLELIGSVEQDGLTMGDAMELEQEMIDTARYLNELLDYL